MTSSAAWLYSHVLTRHVFVCLRRIWTARPSEEPNYFHPLLLPSQVLRLCVLQYFLNIFYPPFYPLQFNIILFVPLSNLFNLLKLEFHLTPSPNLSHHVTFHLFPLASSSLSNLPFPRASTLALARGPSPTVSILTHQCWLSLNPIYHYNTALDNLAQKSFSPPPSPSLSFSHLIRLRPALYTVRSWPAVGCGK